MTVCFIPFDDPHNFEEKKSPKSSVRVFMDKGLMVSSSNTKTCRFYTGIGGGNKTCSRRLIGLRVGEIGDSVAFDELRAVGPRRSRLVAQEVAGIVETEVRRTLLPVLRPRHFGGSLAVDKWN